MGKILNSYLFLFAIAASSCFEPTKTATSPEVDYPQINKQTSFEETKVLAMAGNAIEQHKLGLMYYHGEKTNRSYIQAAIWFRKAAEQGVPSAQSWLGVMYASGRGVEKNDVIAYQWMILGTEQGFRGGELSKASVAKLMSYEQIAEAEKLAEECYDKNYKNC